MISNIGSAAYGGQLMPRPENSAAPLGNPLDPATPLGLSDAPLRLGKSQPAEATQSASFSNFIERAVQEVDGKMKAAGADQARVLSGETNNLHQAMISMQEASLAFSLMVEVRNKLVDSYQELMRMQV
ncbi:MAG TPA: flagellar hook-basal body complex protein FliE [Chthoniobacterales bacterium]|jgi:flagellar hook-basal body complex protein FliE|nr:flagellar hook-basal body complex protein FliE [Chthoniobacterales bacterium]